MPADKHVRGNFWFARGNVLLITEQNELLQVFKKRTNNTKKVKHNN